MVKGNLMTDKQYFQKELDSQSSLKIFSDDRKQYYRRFILKDNIRENETEESKALKIGNIVDCLLLNESEFDEKFFKTTSPKIPSGKMLTFVTALLKHTRINTDKTGEVIKNFKELAKEAYDESGYDRSFDTVLKNFIGSDAEQYYKEKREELDRTIITEQDFTNAENIVKELKSNEFTYQLFQKSDNKLTQLVIEEFELFGLKMKSKLDLVTINHKLKSIQIDDVKITFSVENFKRDYYLYRKSYIQAYVYMKAMEAVKDSMGFGGYLVLPPRFIVADSINYFQPLIYECTQQSITDAEVGFYENGYYYPGVKSIIEDLLWAKENNVWRIGRQNYKSQAIIKL